MSVRVGIVMDPIAGISYKKDSSLAMLLAAQDRGWTLFYMEQQDLYLNEGKARAGRCFGCDLPTRTITGCACSFTRKPTRWIG